MHTKFLSSKGRRSHAGRDSGDTVPQLRRGDVLRPKGGGVCLCLLRHVGSVDERAGLLGIAGAMKLGHVEVMTEVDPHDERVLSQKYRQNSIAGKLALWDETTTAAFAGVCRLTFVCPFCGGEFTGESTQHFFTCSYCSNTFEGEELVRPGGYRREFIMGGRSLPFVQQPLFSFPSPLDVLSKKQAHRAQPIPFTARTA